MYGPVIEGARVRLEPLTEDIVPLACEWFADLAVTRYLPVEFPPSPPQAAEEWLERAAKDESEVTWGISVRGRVIGTTTLGPIDWRNRHAYSRLLIGDRSAWGKGFATEAVRLRTWFAFSQLGLQKLMSSVLADNVAARQVLEKNGYRGYGTSRRELYKDGTWHDLWLCDLIREEWEEREAR